jgi:hypothetical protein
MRAASAALIALIIIAVLRARKRQSGDTDGLYWAYQDRWLLNAFDNYDCAVYGLRGTGQDVLFAHVVRPDRALLEVVKVLRRKIERQPTCLTERRKLTRENSTAGMR